MSDHNGAPRPAPHPIRDDLDAYERFPGVTYPYAPTPPPYNADAEHTSDHGQLRENPSFLQRAGGLALRFGRQIKHTVGHQVHAGMHDMHETWHESIQGLIGDPSTTRGAQAHLREQQLAQLEGRHPSVANTQFASHQRHGSGKTLLERLRRVDTLAQKVGIVVETIAPAKEVLDTWSESWQSILDPRNIIMLRDTYLGMPMGNIENLPSEWEKSYMDHMLLPIRAGGFRRLPEPLKRAYLGMALDVTARPQSPGENIPRNIEGTHDEDGANVLALIEYVDRALRISVLAPREFQEVARQITDKPIEADKGIADRIRQYHVRLENGVYDYPPRLDMQPTRNEREMERQILDRLGVLGNYLRNFETRITDPKDRDWDLADPYRAEYNQLDAQLRQLRKSKKTR